MTPRTTRLPALAWLVQPAYLLVEIAIAVRATTNGQYAVVADSVSALAVACGPGQAVCSPWHVGMNTTFVVFGVLLVLGAPLARRADPSRRGTAVAALWVVAGLSSVAVALAPLDSHPTAHVLVATPVFVAQPLAIALQSRSLAGALRVAGLVLAAVCAAGALAFVLGIGGDDLSGLVERVALWPVKLWLGVMGWRALARSLDGSPGAGPRN